MTTEATPGALGSNDQLGLVPEADLLERLKQRTLPKHGGREADSWKYHWNLPPGDSELHAEAAKAQKRLEHEAAFYKIERQVSPAVGDYVLATKYSDGDPGDAWALGFYAGELDMGNDRDQIKVAPRYLVNDSRGKTMRPKGYRRVARVRKDVGAWLLNVAAKQLEQSPPGTVNLWTMLTPAAFDVSDEEG